MTASHRTIDAHLATLSPGSRAALERLRKIQRGGVSPPRKMHG